MKKVFMVLFVLTLVMLPAVFAAAQGVNGPGVMTDTILEHDICHVNLISLTSETGFVTIETGFVTSDDFFPTINREIITGAPSLRGA